MRIVIFAGYYQPHIGGSCKNIHELAKRLVTHGGHKITVVTCNTESAPTRETIDGVRVLRLPVALHVANQVPIPVPWSLAWMIQDHRFNMVITQTRFFPTSVLGAAYAKLHGLPLIHTERGGCHTVLANPILARMGRAYDHTVGCALMKTATRVVGVSRAAASFCEHIGGPQSVQVIPNGVEVHGDLHESLLDDDKTAYVVYTGRLIHAKGVQDLIQAFDRVVDDWPDTRLVIVGDGVCHDKLLELVRMTRHPDHIAFTGPVPQHDVTSILRRCHIFVNPSYSEGLPTSVAEAASVGLPIVATDVGGTAELIEHGISGILVKPHDVDGLTYWLDWMLRHREKAEQMGDAAKKAMITYNWERITEEWETLIRNAWKETYA